MLKKVLYIFLFLILCAIFYLIHVEAPRFIVEIKHPIIEEGMAAHRPKLIQSFKEKQPNGEYITVITKDSIKLSAYLALTESSNQKGTIILTHGIRSRKEQWLESVKGITDKGYNCVAMDLRAHGQSTGKYCTFGVKEKLDISSILDFLAENYNISKNFGVWGSSLGGAIALQSLAYDKRLKFGIIESTFSEFRSVTQDYFENTLGFRWEFLGNYLVNRSGKLAGFNPEEASPISAAKKVTQPVLMLHGTADKNISIDYGRANFKALSSADKKWVEIKGGEHNGMANADTALYFKELNSFLNKVSEI